MKSHLSIVVPVHTIPSGEGLSALASWSRDIPEECELILSLDLDRDDRSLIDWCEQYIPSRKKIVQQLNRNPGDTRNIGMKLATGDWVAFVDSDDIFNPNNALTAIEHLGESSDLIICRYQTIDLNYNLIRESKNLSRLSELTVNLGFWRCLYRSTVVASTAFPSLRMAEDQIFFSRFMSLNPRVNFSNETIYKYVVGGDQQLTRIDSSKEDLRTAISILQSEINSSRIFMKFRKQLLLRQYTSLLNFSGMTDRIKHSCKLLPFLIRPSYFVCLVSLIPLLVKNRFNNSRAEEL